MTPVKSIRETKRKAEHINNYKGEIYIKKGLKKSLIKKNNIR